MSETRRRVNLTNEVKGTVRSGLQLISGTTDVLAQEVPQTISKGFQLTNNMLDVGIRLTKESKATQLEDKVEETDLEIELEKSKQKLAELKAKTTGGL